MTVISLSNENAIFMNNLKASIRWMQSNNVEGKYDLQIRREGDILQNVFDEVLGREPANDNSEAANAA